MHVTVIGTTAYVADGYRRPSGDRYQQPGKPADHRLRGTYTGIELVMSRSLARRPTWRIDVSGLQVIDVSNPTSPQIIGSVDTPGDG